MDGDADVATAGIQIVTISIHCQSTIIAENCVHLRLCIFLVSHANTRVSSTDLQRNTAVQRCDVHRNKR